MAAWTRAAELSDAPLADSPGHLTPSPGELVGDVFVRRAEGPPGAETVVLVHGLGGSSHNWTDLVHLLSDRLTCVAIDLPGCGHSPPAPAYGLREHAAAVTRLVDGLRSRDGTGPVHLVGNSMGGAICVLVAAQSPDLVRSLTLISPALPTLRPPRVLGVGGRSLWGRWRGTLSVDERMTLLLSLCFADPQGVTPEQRADFMAEARRRAGLGYDVEVFRACLRGLVHSYRWRGEARLWRQLATIEAPGLVVWGRHDRLVSPALAARVARTLPRGRVLLLPDAGHVAQMEQPEAVARALLRLVEEAGTGAGAGPRPGFPGGVHEV